jgi:cytochrome c-type biogenesis protein CcmF
VYPQKRQYWVQRQVTTEAAIEMHHGSNVFVALGDELGAGKWSVRFQIRPLVNFLWLGAFIMAVGGAIAATDQRYRVARLSTAAAPVTPAATEGGLR